MTSSKKVLYLPSTPLNLLVSLVLAETFRHQQTSRLILIDQKKVKDHPYYHLLNLWKNSPFTSVHILSGEASGSEKIAQRRQNFAWLTHYLNKWQPDDVAVGSDRRIEFQYVMAYLQGKQQKARGHYLDDGLYSYSDTNTPAWKAWINAVLHRKVYGSWWQEPKTIGASNWIQDAWLFQPAFATEALRHKQVHTLMPEWFHAPSVLEFSQLAWSHFSGKQPFPLFDHLLLLPHPHSSRHITNYAQSTRQQIQTWMDQGKRVAVKYHPRVGDADPLALAQMPKVIRLPTGLATEFMLPMLNPQVHILGEASTALLTAHWLSPDIQITAQLHPKNSASTRYREVMQQMGIPIA